MITSIERISWFDTRTRKHYEKLAVHHKTGNINRILRYEPFSKLSKTVMEYLEQAKVVDEHDMKDECTRTNRKYERFVK